jgi:glycosyltransferase involved in cell wall biosynthesis
MRADTPKDCPTHLLDNPDAYITRIGRFLRKTSLDELPQIWDILRLKMSVIGPRPALYNQDDLVAERDKYGANRLRPGLTGLAQIRGRDELSIETKARYDGEYVRRRGFFMDAYIFLATVFKVFRSDGVKEGGTGAIDKERADGAAASGGVPRAAVVFYSYHGFGDRVSAVKEFFAGRGFETAVYCSDFVHMRGYLDEGEKEAGVRYVRSPRYKKNISVARMRAYTVWCRRVVRELRAFAPDIVYLLLPPNTLLKEVAALRRRKDKPRIIADIIDLWPESLPVPARVARVLSPVLRNWRDRRNRYLGCCDAVFTECEYYKRILSGQGIDADGFTALYLFGAAPAALPPYTPSNAVRLLYLGSINNIIDIDTIAALLTELASARPVVLHVIGDGEKRAELISRAGQAGAEAVYHGKIYDDAFKLRIMSECDFGLNVYKPTVAVGLTIKSMDYLRGGLPLINTIKGDTRDLVNDLHIGFNYESPQAAANAVLSATPEELTALRTRSAACYAEHFTRERFMETLLKSLQETGTIRTESATELPSSST